MSNINNSELILRLLTSRDELCDWLGRLITKHKAKSNKFDELKHLLQNEQCKKTE